MFDFLTLSVVIDDRIFCVHGGALSPFFSIVSCVREPTQLRRLISIHTFNRPNQGRRPLSRSVACVLFSTFHPATPRFLTLLLAHVVCRSVSLATAPVEIPHEGPIADLVWSDPDPEKEDFAISPR